MTKFISTIIALERRPKDYKKKLVIIELLVVGAFQHKWQNSWLT